MHLGSKVRHQTLVSPTPDIWGHADCPHQIQEGAVGQAFISLRTILILQLNYS